MEMLIILIIMLLSGEEMNIQQYLPPPNDFPSELTLLTNPLCETHVYYIGINMMNVINISQFLSIFRPHSLSTPPPRIFPPEMNTINIT